MYTHNKPPTQTPSHWLLILFEWSVGGILGSYSISPGTPRIHTCDGRMSTASTLYSLWDSFPPSVCSEALEVELLCRNPEMQTLMELLGTNYLALQTGTISKPL